LFALHVGREAAWWFITWKRIRAVSWSRVVGEVLFEGTTEHTPKDGQTLSFGVGSSFIFILAARRKMFLDVLNQFVILELLLF
jgi:hypothetical protein